MLFKAPHTIIEDIKVYWRPPPKLSISEWADNYRQLSAQASSEVGQWRTSRIPYAKEIMDAITTEEKVVWMAASQLGKTEILLNVKGFFIHLDPCPILEVQPTLAMAETISKNRVGPMLEDTPVLRGLVGEKRSRDSDNTILHKGFRGGHLTLCGANSPASLASRPIRILLADEVDRFPVSAKEEGDPLGLAIKRTATFWNRKIVIVSTPTLKGVSRIEFEYALTDKRKYFIPCPHCGEMQILTWGQIKWQSLTLDGKEICEKAWYECVGCGGKIEDHHKKQFLREGEWRPTAKAKTKGYHLWQAYSPWRKFSDLVNDFLECKGDRQKLKVFSNTILGESWDEVGGQGLSWQSLLARCEPYTPLSVPQKAFLLTAGVDVQADRLALSVWGWGRGEEGWLVYQTEIFGDPKQPTIWDQLDAALNSSYDHESGNQLQILLTCVDSSYESQLVYGYTRGKSNKFAVKGASTPNKPIITRPSLQDVNIQGRIIKNGVKLWVLGTNVSKSLLYDRLRISREGPGFLHFPLGTDEEYFKQLTAEKVVTKFGKGTARQEWIKIRPRNESLDCLVYAYAAAQILGIARADWDSLEKKMQPVEEKQQTTDSSTGANKPKPKKNSSWAGVLKW